MKGTGRNDGAPWGRQNFSRVALRFGCTMQQAFAVARWFDLFMAFYFIPKDPSAITSRSVQNRTGNCIAAEAGTTADPEAWQERMNRLLEVEEPGKVEA